MRIIAAGRGGSDFRFVLVQGDEGGDDEVVVGFGLALDV